MRLSGVHAIVTTTDNNGILKVFGLIGFFVFPDQGYLVVGLVRNGLLWPD